MKNNLFWNYEFVKPSNELQFNKLFPYEPSQC